MKFILFLENLENPTANYQTFIVSTYEHNSSTSHITMRNLSAEIENKMTGLQKDIRYYDDGSTDESGGYSEDGGSEENVKEIRKMSSQSEGSQKEKIEDDLNKRENLIESKIQRLKSNVTRTNQFLTELKALSESCQEYIPAIEYEVDEDGELHKERQVRNALCSSVLQN
jgi:hypothetical protein